MNKIKTAVRVTELDTASDVIVRLYKDASIDETGAVAKDSNLAGIMADIERLSAEITTAIKADRISSALDEADIARDEIIRSLGDALTGYAAIPVAMKKAAAESLLPTFSKYGKQIVTKSYAEESSLIESLLEDLGSDKAKESISCLEGVAELVSSLRAAQDAFNKANDEFTAAKISRGVSASAVKKTLLSALNNRFVPYMKAVGSLPGYTDFNAKAASEIDKANAAVSARSTAKARSAEETA